MLAAIGLTLLQLAVCAARPADAAEPPVSVVVGPARYVLVKTPAGMGALTMSMLDGSRTGGYWDLGERAGQLRPNAKKVVMLGMGGGEMLRAARRSLPNADLLGIDNDAKMLKAAVAEFHVERFGARTQLGDAFTAVKKLSAVDVLLVDLFVGDTMPPKMLSQTFWRDCRAAIGPQGLIAVNVYPAHLVGQVEALLAFTELSVIERHADKGGSTVLFAESKFSSGAIDLGDLGYAYLPVIPGDASCIEIATNPPQRECWRPDGGPL